MINGFYGILPTDKTKKKLAEKQNNIEFNNTFNNLLNLAENRFEYDGLPDTFDTRLFESALIWRGYAAGEKDEADNIWSWSAGPGGILTRYGYPSEGYLYALNGETKHEKFYWKFMDNTDAKAVLCLNDRHGYPSIFRIMRGAERIADARRALDVAANNSKRPFVFSGTEEQAKTIQSIYNDMQNNQPYIIVQSKQVGALQPAVMSTNFHEGSMKELWDYYINTRNDVLNELGIITKSNNDKKERMTTTETMGDVDLITKELDYQLREREEFCERMNEAFGLNCSVKIKESPLEVIEQQLQAQEQEGFDNDKDTERTDND